MHLHFYNTEKRIKEIFDPQESGKVKMYTCGPTVYNYAHIGNFRTYIFEDILRKTLKYFGFEVFQVMNLTDVEDKTILSAQKEGIPLDEYTAKFKQAFFEDLKTLHIESAEAYPAATDHIEQMVTMIEKLLSAGVAYRGQDQSIYFRIREFPSYGRLSHLKLQDLKEGASERLTNDEYDKDNASDFVLWKSYDEKRDGQIFWETSLGKGRPGWHIECSAMAIHLLGENIDIHCGGVDNIFPHHDNEIAQSEACTGKHFVRYWMHSEHLIVEGKKMSKSAGNFYTLRDLQQKGYTGEEVRFLLLSGHYRTQLNFTFQGLDAARKSVKRIKECYQRLSNEQQQESTMDIQGRLKEAKEAFDRALADDLNTPQALAALFDSIREINTWLDQEVLNQAQSQQCMKLFTEMNSVLSLNLQMQGKAIPEELIQALQKRNEARVEKNWDIADAMRKKIEEAGYLVVDTPEGSHLKPKEE